jgi:16S rRNA processing protein RimM
MDFIEIGVVLKPQGIKGEMKIKPLVDDLEALKRFKTVYMTEGGEYAGYEVLNARTDAESAYMGLKGIDDRNAAELKRNQYLYVKKEELPLPEGTHFVDDIVGMSVYGDEGALLGTLKEVIQTGAVDVYAVANENGGFMFPALKRVILETDVENKKMTLDEKALSEVSVHEV